MTYPSLSPGDDPGPIFSASRHNAINELLAKSGIDSTATAKIPGSKRQNTIALVKNTTDTDVPRGGVLGLSGLIFDADDNESAFAGNDIQFDGEKPTSESHADRIGIAIDLCPQSKIRSFVVDGWVQAKVDITNEHHRYAKIVEGDVEKLVSCSSGGVPMIPAQPGAGVKWAIVLLGPVSGQSVLLVRCEDGLEVVVEDVSLSGVGRAGEKLSDLIGKVVLLYGDALLEESCWIVASNSDCGGTLCPTVCDIMDNCDDCGGCYSLVDCDSIQANKIVNRSDICSFGFVIQPGDTVRLDDGTCWEVENTEYCEEPDTVVIESVSPSCSECGRCLELTRCGSSESKIIYKDDLGYSVGDVFKIKGECWEVTDEGECTGTPEHVPDTSQVYDDCAECGCYKLTPCDDHFTQDFIDHPIYVTKDDGGKDLSELVGKVVMVHHTGTSQGGCYTVSESYECGTINNVTVLQEFPYCSNSDGDVTYSCRVWEVKRCDDDEGSDYPVEKTFSPLEEARNLNGPILKRAEDGHCYEIIGSGEWNSGVPDFEVTPEEWYEECLDCTDPKYQLTQCGGCDETPEDLSSFTTSEDLIDAVGKVIKVDGICYVVSKLPNDATVDQESITYLGPYSSCKVCNPEELWVVTNVYEDGDKLKQDRKRVIVQQVCDEETVDIIDLGDCDD